MTTWELFIAYSHLFMQRLRRAGQEGCDFDQDQEIWGYDDDDDEQPPPGAPPGAGRTRLGVRVRPGWGQGPGGSSTSEAPPPGGGWGR